MILDHNGNIGKNFPRHSINSVQQKGFRSVVFDFVVFVSNTAFVFTFSNSSVKGLASSMLFLSK